MVKTNTNDCIEVKKTKVRNKTHDLYSYFLQSVDVSFPSSPGEHYTDNDGKVMYMMTNDE